MANTTDIVIVSFDEEVVIREISRRTGIDFRVVSDGERAGGSHVLSITTHGATYRCLGEEKLKQLIHEFRTADFQFPELAVLVIDDDNQVFNGVVVREVTNG